MAKQPKKPTPATDREWLAYCAHLRRIRDGYPNLPLEMAFHGAHPWQGPPLPRPLAYLDHPVAAVARWWMGEPLYRAVHNPPEGYLPGVYEALGREFFADSLGAIRVDLHTSKDEVDAAFEAIRQLKEQRREALGLVPLPAPPVDGNKRDVGDWWPGVVPGSIYHRRLTALYLRTIAEVSEVVEWDAKDPRWPAKLRQRPPTVEEVARTMWPEVWKRVRVAEDAHKKAPPHRKDTRYRELRAARQAVKDTTAKAEGLLCAAEADLATLPEEGDRTR